MQNDLNEKYMYLYSYFTLSLVEVETSGGTRVTWISSLRFLYPAMLNELNLVTLQQHCFIFCISLIKLVLNHKLSHTGISY